MGKVIGESGLIQRVRQSLGRVSDGLVEGHPALAVVAGYSGGADSLALVVVLRELERLGLIRLLAAHVDHGTRVDSARDAAEAEAVAKRLGVAFRLCRIDPEALASHHGVGLEEAMRRERYRLLAMIASEIGATVIATGHHQRDQAETVLLHLLRGAGLRGAAGMREVSSIEVPWWTNDRDVLRMLLWRPLLLESPGTLRALVMSLGLPVIEDDSNDSDVFRRNAVRHQALPILNAIVPGAEANLAAFARRAADDDAALDAIAGAYLGVPTHRLDRMTLLGQPVAIQRRMLRMWITALAPGVELTAERTDAMLTLVEHNIGGKLVEVGAGRQVAVGGGMLMLMKR